MKFSTLIKHSAELFRIIHKSPTPADELASQYLRAKKYIGSSERKIISEIVFCTLRISSLAAKACDEFSYDHKLSISDEQAELYQLSAAVIVLLEFPNSPLAELQNLLNKFLSTGSDFAEYLATAIAELEILPDLPKDFIIYCKQFTAKFLEIINSDSLASHHYLCMQPWMIESLSAKYSAKDINNLAFRLMYPAPVCLRVNTLSANRSLIMDALAANSIKATPSNYSPDGIILANRPQLNNFEFYRNGSVEVQDIGSQLISYSLAPENNTDILDACAGAGGKTLHIAALTKDEAKIIATDLEFNRLKEIKIRANKSGIASIAVIPQRKMELKNKIKHQFDYILIDAPCSGTGTIRRMPMPKWRLSPKQLAKLNKAQSEILEYYSGMLNVGGTLVYATCSLLSEENENIVHQFLSKHPDFAPLPIRDSSERTDLVFPGLKDEDFMLSLTPLNGETDGFFMAKITRID